MSHMPLAFDHLVVIMRDQLQDRAPLLARDGYHLTELAVHNLGSMNHLITLDTSYIELLGWPPGKPPERKEIAAQPLGLDALVFRMADAAATRLRLLDDGFTPGEVQRLERPAPGRTAGVVRFDTLRFAVQPVAGLRVYFCQHLTPEYVWYPEVMNHPNGAQSLARIIVDAPDAQAAQVLARLANGNAVAAEDGYIIQLPNLALHIRLRPDLAQARIAQATVRHRDGRLQVFDPHV